MGRARWAMVVGLTVVAVSGCDSGKAGVGETSSSSNPAPGGSEVTFENGPEFTSNCNDKRMEGYWTTEDAPGEIEQTPNVGGRWTFRHTFPVQAPGTSRTYLVQTRSGNSTACADGSDWAPYRQTIAGPPTAPVSPPAVDPPPADPPPVTQPQQAGPPPLPPGPIAEFAVSPAAPDVEVLVTFDGTASQGAIARYDWAFGTDASPQTATGQVVQSRFNAAGSFPVRLTVTDQFGRTAWSTRFVTVTDPGAAGSRVVATTARRSRPAPGVFLSTSPGPLRAGTVLRLSADAQRGVAAGRRYAWDLDGDGRFGRASGSDSVLTVLRRPGARTVALRMRDARGRVHTSEARIVVRASPRPAGLVRQRFVADLRSRATARRAVRRFVRRLPRSRKLAGREIGDAGALVLRALNGFRPGAQTLMAPLLAARTRGRLDVDPATRSIRGTYVLSSTAMRSRVCLRVTATYTRDGAKGQIRSLGGTGAGRRLRVGGSFTATGSRNLTSAVLSGTLLLSRGAATRLPAECRDATR